MKELEMEQKEGLLLCRCKLKEQVKKIAMGILDGDINYRKVKEVLKNIMEQKDKKKRERT